MSPKQNPKKIVSMLSTIHSGKTFRGTDRPVMKPDVIVDYNKTMRGVDLLSSVDTVRHTTTLIKEVVP